ncbi:MAG: hypothetical protein ABIG89_03605 [Candidatus Woesearchaeota archaeon]
MINIGKIRKYLASALAAVTMLTANPASADKFELFGGYGELYESSAPKVTLEMRADAEFNNTVHFGMRNKIGYFGEPLVSIENGLYFRVINEDKEIYKQSFGPLVEFHIGDLTIPKIGVFLHGNYKDFMFYLAPKIMPGNNMSGEAIFELGYIPEDDGFMITAENRTILDGSGHNRSTQSIRMGYRIEGVPLGIGVGADIIEIGNDGDFGWCAGAFFGIYGSNRIRRTE